MLTLAVDTSATQGSVALVRDGRVVVEIDLRLETHATSHILPAIEWATASAGVTLADIDLFAAAEGPGSFTGLRIGIATVLGLARGAGKPAAGVPTLHAVAYPWLAVQRPVLATVDTRSGRVFAQVLLAGEAGEIEELTETVSVDVAGLAALVREMALNGAARVSKRPPRSLDEPAMRKIEIPGTVPGTNRDGDGVLLDPQSSILNLPVLVGDGMERHRVEIAALLPPTGLLPPPGVCYHRASHVAILAERAHRLGQTRAPRPIYVSESSAAHAPPQP